MSDEYYIDIHTLRDEAIAKSKENWDPIPEPAESDNGY